MELQNGREVPKAYELYKHFKGKIYQIIALAKDCEDGSLQVVYQALYGDYQIYVRSFESFMSLTDLAKYPDAKQKYRFEKVDSKDEPASRIETEQEKDDKTSIENLAEVSDVTLEKEESIDVTLEKEEASDVRIEKETAIDEQEEAYATLDPAIRAYLAAEGTDERLEILRGVRDRVTSDMLATMSIVTDIELSEGSVEEQYQSLLNCLLMKQKYEKVRRY